MPRPPIVACTFFFTYNYYIMLLKKINLAILNAYPFFGKTLKNYITGMRNVSVVIQSPGLQDLLEKLEGSSVDILLMDIFLSDAGSVESIKLIKAKNPDIKVLVLTMCTDSELLNDLIDAGVYGIISKADEPEELECAIISLSEQRIYRSKIFDNMIWSRQSGFKLHNETGQVPLNEREQEVLKMLWEEKSNKEIAGHLYLGIKSIEKIRQDMKAKLGVKSTIGLIKYGIDKRIIKIANPSILKQPVPENH
jgi:DNA-binding NarL/FixJ family response regulator